MENEFLFPDKQKIEKQYVQEGEQIEMRLVNHKTPIFGYNFLSMSRTNDCFNHEILQKKEYTSYFQIVKEMSGLTIQELLDKEDKYHFHEIKDNALRGIEYKVKNLLRLPANMSFDELPTIAQFGLYTDPPIEKDGEFVSKAPRVIFALSGLGLLNILFLDFNHNTYKKVPENKSKVRKEIKKITHTIKGVKGIAKMLNKNYKRN